MFLKFIVHVRYIYIAIYIYYSIITLPVYLNLCYLKFTFCDKLTASCTDRSVRIAGGDSLTYGRVEVCISSLWGTVCSDSFWDNTDAGVVCRQLGFYQHGKFLITTTMNVFATEH